MTWNILNLNTKPIAGDTPEDFSLNAIVQFFLFDISPTMVNPLYWLKWHSVEPGQILIYLGSQNLSSDKNLTQCLQNLNSRKTNSIAGIISSVEREREKMSGWGAWTKASFRLSQNLCRKSVWSFFFTEYNCDVRKVCKVNSRWLWYTSRITTALYFALYYIGFLIKACPVSRFCRSPEVAHKTAWRWNFFW